MSLKNNVLQTGKVYETKIGTGKNIINRSIIVINAPLGILAYSFKDNYQFHLEKEFILNHLFKKARTQPKTQLQNA